MLTLGLTTGYSYVKDSHWLTLLPVKWNTLVSLAAASLVGLLLNVWR